VFIGIIVATADGAPLTATIREQIAILSQPQVVPGCIRDWRRILLICRQRLKAIWLPMRQEAL
jgi:hypothetical protein